MEFTERHVQGLKDLVYKMADDMLIIGHRNSEWTGLGPIVEEDISFSSMAQDKIGQSLALYEILHDLGESDPDTVAFSRNDFQFHCSHLVEMPIGGYDFSMVRHFFFDHAEAIRFEMLQDCVFEPLQMVVKKFKGEVKYHTMHADIWMKQLCAAGGESKARIQEQVNATFALALGMFEPSEYELELQEAGIFEGEIALKNKWLATVVPMLESYGLTVPTESSVIPTFGGRKGKHTPHLQPLLDEMTEVFRIDPSAEW